MIYKFDNNQTNTVPNPTVPLIFKAQGKPWVQFGTDNLYPSYITELYNKSAINKRALQSKILGVFGEGLKTTVPELEYILNRANDNETWNDVFEKIVTDYEIYGGFALNVIWNATGEKIHSFYHMPFESVRSGEIDSKTNRVEQYYYCSDWPKVKKHKPITYQSFDPNKSLEFGSQILYFFDYSPGSPYYPLPSYSGGLQDITIDIEVANLHLSNLANGLNPSLVINFKNGIPDPRHQQEVYDAIASSFAGTQNTGKFFCTFSESSDSTPDVIPVDSANDDYYVNLESRITTRILSSHGITSPLLMGLYHEGSGGLGSNKDEILVAYQHFLNTVLKPDIKALLKPMDMLVRYFGYNTKLYIKPAQVVEIEDINKNEVQTSIA